MCEKVSERSIGMKSDELVQRKRDFDHTKPARTNDGLEARFLGKIKDEKYPLAYAVAGVYGQEEVIIYTLDGKYSTGKVSELDLENIPEKHVYYLNVETSDGVKLTGEFYKSSTEASDEASEFRTECIRVEFEDGQFDE